MEQERIGKMTPNAASGAWFTDDKHDEGLSGENHPGERRSTWRDRAADRPDDQISEEIKRVLSDDNDLTSEGSLDDQLIRFGENYPGRRSTWRYRAADRPVSEDVKLVLSDDNGLTSEELYDDQLITFGPCIGGMSRNERFKSASANGYARTNMVDGPSGYVDPRRSFGSSRRPAGSVQELQLRREELLLKYEEIQDQLSDLDDALDAAEALSYQDGSGLRAEVYVNGQAITCRSIKRAEKFAGQIKPGEYWYDSKVGFWGVMGHRASGIIPPFIQEFSSPMAENCSKGDSAVYVNGRELPKQELELLSNRGLPSTRDKHYVVNISGSVLDQETGDFVNLGRLAPSVEKNRRGFGMHVPEELAD